jgi:hypothetical protein
MPKPKITTLLTIRKTDWYPGSDGFRFSVNMPKTDENNAGKITGVRVSNTTVRVQKNTA